MPQGGVNDLTWECLARRLRIRHRPAHERRPVPQSQAEEKTMLG